MMTTPNIASQQYSKPWVQKFSDAIFYPLSKWFNFEKLGRNLFEGALDNMPYGELVIHYPDGSCRRFGNGDIHPGRFSPSAEMTIHDSMFFKRILLYGHVGASESYMAGEWDTPSIRSVIAWFIANVDDSALFEGSSNKQFWVNILGYFNNLIHKFRPNSMSNSAKNIQAHYDLSNDFFKLFLDQSLTYSSGLFITGHETLNEAQINKYQALIDGLRLTASDSVLEIGSGWGGFAIYAAKTVGCSIKTITISQQQYRLARQRIESEGLAHLIDIELRDYRTVEGQFDKIVSIEMVEALGDAYYETFWKTCHQLLKPHGLVGIQMITCPDSRYHILKDNVDFIQKHIFPGSLLPSVGRMTDAIRKTGTLSLFEMKDMGLSYARTLNMWWQAFNQKLDVVREQGFDESFIRKWNYYLQYCEAAFMMRNISVVQAIYTRPNNITIADSIVQA